MCDIVRHLEKNYYKGFTTPVSDEFIHSEGVKRQIYLRETCALGI